MIDKDLTWLKTWFKAENSIMSTKMRKRLVVSAALCPSAFARSESLRVACCFKVTLTISPILIGTPSDARAKTSASKNRT